VIVELDHATAFLRAVDEVHRLEDEPPRFESYETLADQRQPPWTAGGTVRPVPHPDGRKRAVPAALVDLVRADPAVADLRTYFAEDAPLPYTGRRFEALDGGGDRIETRDVIIGSDLIAVQMLSVKFPAEVAIDLLDGDLGRQMTRLLAEIPAGVDLGTDGAEVLVADRNHADRAWHLVEKQRGVGYVIAGKLMARKRPRLIPGYDRVLSCLFGAPDHVWMRLHHQLAANNGELRAVLADLRTRAKIPATVSLLRVLDVILWMGHRDTHQPNSCPGFGSVAL
jgi:hypothetical protein